MDEQEEKPSFPRVRIFQMHGTYLFAQGKGGLYIIDQHAVGAGQYGIIGREDRGCGPITSSSSWCPISTVPADDMSRIKQRMELLEDAGIFLEEYGANEFISAKHPIWFKKEIGQDL